VRRAVASGSGSRPAPKPPSSATVRVSESGMATAEFAVVTMALVILMGFLLALAAVAVANIRAHEAARAGARSAARGETNRQVAEVARRNAPSATVTVARSAGSVRVTVTARPRLIPGLQVPAVEVRATSTAEREPR